MFAGMSVHVLPESIYDVAMRLYPNDGPNAIRRLTESISESDLRRMAVIAVENGPAAAEQFFLSRPRRLRVFSPRKARFRD